MLVTENIKSTFKDIGQQTVNYLNKPDDCRKYHKRLLKIFRENLTEEEQLFVMKALFEHVHYKNIVTDPDNVILLHNIKLRTMLMGFLGTTIVLIISAILFKTNDSLNNLVQMIGNGFKLFSI